MNSVKLLLQTSVQMPDENETAITMDTPQETTPTETESGLPDDDDTEPVTPPVPSEEQEDIDSGENCDDTTPLNPWQST